MATKSFVMRRNYLSFLFTAWVLTLGCASDAEVIVAPQDRIPVLLSVLLDQSVLVPSSTLRLELGGSERLTAQFGEIIFSGTSVVRFDVTPSRNADEGNLYVDLPVEMGLWTAIEDSGNGSFYGEIDVIISDDIGVVAEGRATSVLLTLQRDVTPRVSSVATGNVFLYEEVAAIGTGFLRPEEGSMWVFVDGAVEYGDGTRRSIDQKRTSLVWTGSRNEAAMPIDVAVFGVRVGEFVGSLRFENELRTGPVAAGSSIEAIEFSIMESFIATLSPEAGSRGQKITMIGRGLIPNDAMRGHGMLLRYEGVLTLDDGGRREFLGSSAIERAPDHWVNDAQVEQAVWYTIDGLVVTGLGAEPGVFEGSITPILYDMTDDATGLPWTGSFRILPSKQVVHLKYLPAFSRALEKFGLVNVEFDIRSRVLEVVRRDYEGVHVAFSSDRPTDFIDYATIELGGVDPSGARRFGYDNTCNVQSQRCKDTDNLYLSDYLGGVNSASEEQFQTPYGGIFLDSFDYFSKTLGPSANGSPEFDRVLGPFMPALGGSPVQGTEWPDGERRLQIGEAIRMVGSVVGNTISHEIGHSIGLSFYPEDRIRPGDAFHNTIPCDNCLMDAGGDRPFEERAELLGAGPAHFNERNFLYLQEILRVP
jgi:hypothetical protein